MRRGTVAKSFALGWIIALSGCQHSAREPLSQEAYVWQRAWNPAVSTAVSAAPDSVAGWRVLVAQADPPQDWQQFSADQQALTLSHKTLTAVIRIDGRRALTDSDALAARIRAYANSASGVPWTRLEIDYDCPTRTLPQYAAFLSQVRSLIPARLALSITVLPTWIGSRHLRELLEPVDEAVLQVHSVLDPRQGLFDPRRAHEWSREFARATDKPFKVALPTYGSRVSWDRAGKLVAVTSEAPPESFDADSQELQSSPQVIADFLRQLDSDRPRRLRGIVWFRLPVQGDRRNWSTATWTRVMSGLPLTPRLEVLTRVDAAGAWQLHLSNAGDTDGPLPQTIILNQACLAADGGQWYSLEREPARTLWRRRTARYLATGQEISVGWIRCTPSTGGLQVED